MCLRDRYFLFLFLLSVCICDVDRCCYWAYYIIAIRYSRDISGIFFHFISVITNAVVFVVVPSLMSIKAYIYFINFLFVICLYYLLFIFYFFLYVWALCQNLEFKKKCFLSSIVCFHYICVLLRICFVQCIIWREFCWYYSSLLEKACIFISLLSKSINYEKDGVWFH